MQRSAIGEAFIRVLGGSIVAAALPPLAGCSSDYPGEAVAAVARPAMRAPTCAAGRSPTPSSRPTRTTASRGSPTCASPTRSCCASTASACCPRPTRGSGRSSSARAPSSRRWRSPCASAASSPRSRSSRRANSRRGRSTTGRSPASPGGRPPAGPAADPLFAQLLRRHTAKVDYDTARPVAAATLAALRGVVTDPAVRFGATVEPALRDALRAICLESARVEIRTPRTMMESIRLIRLGPDEIARHRDGISVNALVPRLAAAVGAFDRSAPPRRRQRRLQAGARALRRAQPHGHGLRLAVDAGRRVRGSRAAARCAPAAPTCACS